MTWVRDTYEFLTHPWHEFLTHMTWASRHTSRHIHEMSSWHVHDISSWHIWHDTGFMSYMSSHICVATQVSWDPRDLHPVARATSRKRKVYMYAYIYIYIYTYVHMKIGRRDKWVPRDLLSMKWVPIHICHVTYVSRHRSLGTQETCTPSPGNIAATDRPLLPRNYIHVYNFIYSYIYTRYTTDDMSSWHIHDMSSWHIHGMSSWHIWVLHYMIHHRHYLFPCTHKQM